MKKNIPYAEIKQGGWIYFASEDIDQLDDEKSGKWMHWFKDQAFAVEICRKAMSEGVCIECKCLDLSATKATKGVICFYANGDDVKAHKRIITFMLKNDLIPKTNENRLFNISFKFDSQTRAGEYGKTFESKLSLDQFVDLHSHKWVCKKARATCTG